LTLFAEGLHPQFAEAISGVRPDPLKAILRGLHRAIAEVLNDLTVINRLQSEYLALL